jgi:hypothetical protein
MLPRIAAELASCLRRFPKHAEVFTIGNIGKAEKGKALNSQQQSSNPKNPKAGR